MRWVHVLLLTIIVLLPAGKATAKVYRCQGASGSTVLTDQPKGKTGCVAIDTATPAPGRIHPAGRAERTGTGGTAGECDPAVHFGRTDGSSPTRSR